MGRLQDVTLLWPAAGVVEQFAEKPGKAALRELTQGSKYSSETQPFEVIAAMGALESRQIVEMRRILQMPLCKHMLTACAICDRAVMV